MPVGVIATSSYVPERVVDNSEISRWTGASPAWLAERTGVVERRYADCTEATSDMAAEAGRRALAQAGPEVRGQIGAIVVATCTPDSPQPATAALVQHKLGLRGVPCFDLNAVCSGFLYGLIVGESLCTARADSRYVLVIGADMFSRIMDRRDRRTVSLFGDGAGALILGPVETGGIVASRWHAEGEYHDLVRVTGGGTARPLDGARLAAGEQFFRMDGRLVRDWVEVTMEKLVCETAGDAGMSVHDVDRFVFHQANPRLLEALAGRLGVVSERVEVTCSRYGNTAAASVPLTLDEAGRRNAFRVGEHILMAAVGGGLTAGAVLVEWR